MSTLKKRIQLIDGLRGFSLAGIVLANMLAFQYGMFGQSKPQLFGIGGVDQAFLSFLQITVVGSFMPIFAFMFGFGMIKLSESLQSRDLRPKCHLARRFLLLFGIGLLHITYLWEGDILSFYGVLGFFLLMFLNRKPKTLLIWAVLLLVGAGLLGLPASNPMNPLSIESTHMENYIIQSQDVYGNGNYEEIRDFSNNGDPFGGDLDVSFALLALVLAPLMTVPMFLLGMHAARMGTFSDPQAMRHMYLRRASFLIPVGLILKAYGVLAPQFGAEGWPGIGIGGTLGGMLLALGYIYAFAMLYAGSRRYSLMRRFEAVGRLSLTNYLMQSVICTTIFYGYGLGLFGRAGVIIGAIIALAVYGTQLWLSPLYLKKFSSGPVEYLLRIWTYLSWKGQPRKKKRSNTNLQDSAPRVH
ncbi:MULTISPECIES: DUF418 domain-containing protein [Paenibacillus]|uniref:DUF418 domain-containing protein n=1 Tax=Paenibacillus pabuli TaxID=1472 RepID=A0A855XSP4_9BACL|nr:MULTISPECIES: DUF418 domain-containing protein [Paenibacillus]PWW36176.1 uncharacterized protein DET56_111210 [Paenibacillus pabuli]PXW03255.1 uncharacterized protein DEU73_110210 [Paenibacillus taichungensis]